MASWRGLTALVLACAVTAASHGHAADPPSGDWPVYGHDPGSTRFSPLAQINRDNVSKLTVAWTFHTGDISDGRGDRRRSGFETTPIVVDNTLYLTTGFNRVIALDPATGAQRWASTRDCAHVGVRRRPDQPRGGDVAGPGTSGQPALPPAHLRGDARRASGRARRRDGTAVRRLRHGGQVSLTARRPFSRGRYHMTSPPAVIDKLVVVGSSIDDNSRVDMPRASSARSTRARARCGGPGIRFRATKPSRPPIPEALAYGAANAWSIIAVDPERHLVFVPTGSASPDYYGGLRPGDTSGRTPSSRCARRRANSRGASSSCTTTSGTTTRRRGRCSRRSREMAVSPRRGAGQQDRLPLRAQPRYRRAGVSGRRTARAASDVPGEAASPTQPFPTCFRRLDAAASRPTTSGGRRRDRDACRARMRRAAQRRLLHAAQPAGRS